MRDDPITDHVVGAIGLAASCADPFHHLRLQQIFPPETYAAMLRAMPSSSAYRPMSGRAHQVRASDGVPTRTKLHLFPEFIRELPPAHREVWSSVGIALLSEAVRNAFMHRLAPGLERRFGAGHARVGMYAVPMLTRDVPGYHIGIHPDTSRKAMTIQIYLPVDDSIGHAGTLFHRRLRTGEYERSTQVPFLPNSGYAFAVGDDTYHSLDVLGPEIATRDSILLTYFSDHTPWQVVRNRANRVGNLLAHKMRRRD
jgi:hypothetical protein